MSDSPSIMPINRVADLSTATDFELKHLPMVEAQKVEGGYKLKIEVGEVVKHPSGPDHWIVWVDVRVDGTSIARIDLAPACSPRFALNLALDEGTVVEVLEFCNLHGTWATEVTL